MPPTHPVAISLYSYTTPIDDNIPSTTMAKNICGLSFPNTFVSFVFYAIPYANTLIYTADKSVVLATSSNAAPSAPASHISIFSLE